MAEYKSSPKRKPDTIDKDSPGLALLKSAANELLTPDMLDKVIYAAITGEFDEPPVMPTEFPHTNRSYITNPPSSNSNSQPFTATGGSGGGSSELNNSIDPQPMSSLLPTTSGSSGGYLNSAGDWQQPNNPLISQDSYTQRTYQGWYYPNGITTTDRTSPVIPPQTQEEPRKPKYTSEQLKGKFVAYATIRLNDVEHTGILFVRKCGAWKLIDCKTMNRVAGGSEGAELPEHIIHYYIFKEASVDGTAVKKKYERFEQIDIEADIEVEV
jgi:hypothetical protein